ncbi:MAG: hypothetical protein AAGC86_06905 [Pseudomonadota bacterium]
MTRRTGFLAILCAALLIAGQAMAACVLGEMRTDQPPLGPDGKPTEVEIAIQLVDFLGVDDVNQQIAVDLRLELLWRDPRLAGFEGCRFGVTQIWFPRIELANSSALRAARQQAQDQVAIGPDGLVTYTQRYAGNVSSYHRLQDFPFDRQSFRIDLLVTGLSADEMVFVANNDRSGIAYRLNVEGWAVDTMTLSDSIVAPALLNYELSVASLTIDAHREPAFFVYRVLLPLVLVVAMSWTIFWVPPSKYEFQIGLGATAMLTAIAFTISISGRLPPLGYLTTLDEMLIWAVCLVFLSIVEALYTGLLVLRGREALAERIDRIARFVAPALLFLGWGVLYAL